MKNRCEIGAVIAVAVMAMSALSAGYAVTVDSVLGEYRQLQGNAEGFPYTEIHDEVMNRVMELDRKTDAEWLAAAKAGAATLKAKQAATRKAWIDSLGGFPEKSPLNPVVTGTYRRDGYRIEKVMFESRPNHHVTATVFVPESEKFKAPYPAVAIACGHSFEGKMYPNYQRPGVIGARNGFVVIVYDPIDQGERLQRRNLQGDDGRRAAACTTGHNNVGYRATLLGWNTAQFRIWDGIRAIDYLCSRPDVDAKRIAVTGHSGGGTESSYLMALDERVRAAAPSGFITNLRELAYLCGPQDAEQKFYGQLAFGLNHLGILLLRGDRCAEMPLTTHADFFPFMGATATRDLAREAFAALGRSESFYFIDAPGPHLWPESSMQSEFRWFRKWLNGEQGVWNGHSYAEARKFDVGFSYDDPAVDTGMMREPESERNVIKTGFVVDVPGERTVYDIMREEVAKSTAERKKLDRATVARLAAVGDADRIAFETLNRCERTLTLDGKAIKVTTAAVCRGDDAILLPFTCFSGEKPQGAPAMLVPGSADVAALAPRVEALLREGRAVAVVEPRQFGRTDGICRRHGEIWWNEGRFYGNPHPDEMTAVMMEWLGESLVGRRAEDLMILARASSEVLGTKKPFAIETFGRAAIPAAHAFFLEPARFGSFAAHDAPRAWSELFKDDSLSWSFADVVHGAMRFYDWPDLAARDEPSVVEVDATRVGAEIPNVSSVLTIWNGLADNPSIENVSAKYPSEFVEYVEMMSCTGGAKDRDLFRDPSDRTKPDDYAFGPFVEVCRGILGRGAKPYLKLGNVPCKFSEDYDGGEFSLNIRPPTDHVAHYRYLKALAEELVRAFGRDEVRKWRFAVLTEADNVGWFRDRSGDAAVTREEFFKLYDYAAQAFTETLGKDIVFGTHLLYPGDPGCQSQFSIEDVVNHCAYETNRVTGAVGAPLSLLTISYYVLPYAGQLPFRCHGALRRVRTTLESAGFTNVVVGIDEGRIILGNPGRDRADIVPRAVGQSYEAAFDVRVERDVLDGRADYCATWSHGCLTDEKTGEIPSHHYFTCREFSRFAGLRRAAATVNGDYRHNEDVDVVAGASADGSEVRIAIGRLHDNLVFTNRMTAAVAVKLPARFAGREIEVETLTLDDRNNWFTQWETDRRGLGIADSDYSWSPDGFTVLGHGLISDEHRRQFLDLAPKYAKTAAGVRPVRRRLKVTTAAVANIPIDFVGNGAVFVTIKISLSVPEVCQT